jgi:hypothetical protein
VQDGNWQTLAISILTEGTEMFAWEIECEDYAGKRRCVAVAETEARALAIVAKVFPWALVLGVHHRLPINSERPGILDVILENH